MAEILTMIHFAITCQFFVIPFSVSFFYLNLLLRRCAISLDLQRLGISSFRAFCTRIGSGELRVRCATHLVFFFSALAINLDYNYIQKCVI